MEIYLAQCYDRRIIPYLAGEHDIKNGRTMELYLAGEHDIKNGRTMELYLAGENGKSRTMELYLAGENGKSRTMELEFIQKIKSPLWNNISVLESFHYARKNTIFPKLYRSGIFKNLLLDSGAFTFMQNNSLNIDWDRYINDYADFINKYDIRLFFELDIDKIVGLEKVEKMRDKLYGLTGKKPIPVWHKSRGKDYFDAMCDEYDYVAVGGLVGKSDDVEDKYLPYFIHKAHEKRRKIHGLGFTRVSKLKNFHFDSVDSTSWLQGNRSGFIYKFDYKRGKFEQIRKENTRVNPRLAAIYNFNEWLKFQDYARKYL